MLWRVPQFGTAGGLTINWVGDATHLSEDWSHLSIAGIARKAEMLGLPT